MSIYLDGGGGASGYPNGHQDRSEPVGTNTLLAGIGNRNMTLEVQSTRVAPVALMIIPKECSGVHPHLSIWLLLLRARRSE